MTVAELLDELKAKAKAALERIDALKGDPCELCGLWHWGTCLDHAVRVREGRVHPDRLEQLRRELDESRLIMMEHAYVETHQARFAQLRRDDERVS